MELKRAHLFRTGEHPGTNAAGLHFDEAALDGIVSAFDKLRQAGRVPLRFGHTESKPGQPALGWVQRIWREGQNLFGDLVDLPTTVYEAVRKGLFKFTSIELLKGAQRGGETIPYLLDGVALLGADPPAVDGLEDLQRLTHSRVLPAGEFAERLSFTADFTAQDDGDARDRKIARLEAQLAEIESQRASFAAQRAKDIIAAHRRDIADVLEKAVRERRMLPAHRERLLAKLGTDDDCLRFTRADAELYAECHDQAPSIALLFQHTARQPPAGEKIQADPPHESLAERARALFAAKRAPDLFTCLTLAVQENPAEMRAILDHDLIGGWQGAL